jgi:enoyl-CoA hydratase
MADPLLLVETGRNGVATMRLNRPPMNALSQALLGEIADAASALADDAAVKSVVVLGREKVFSAGADIGEFDDGAAARRISRGFRAAFDGLGAIARPVIAAVNGVALGGGLELALACDLRIAGDRARLGQPEILLGIIPGAGATQRLPRLVGPARAKEMIWSGRQVQADEALAMGLVDRVAPAAELEAQALAWAGELASGAVVAMGYAKRAIDDGLDGSLSRGIDVEEDAFVASFDTDDANVGVASFLEHGPGKAQFSGR